MNLHTNRKIGMDQRKADLLTLSMLVFLDGTAGK
jgi:hypothetical protein